MAWFPPLQLGWLNGWIPAALFYLVYLCLLLIFPREVVSWLYDRSQWTRQQTLLGSVGLPFAFAGLGLILATPLKINLPVFWVGLGGYLLGFAGFIWSMISFRSTPLNQPVTGGLYRASRNPQWLTFVLTLLSICLMIGSWTALGLFSVRIMLNHFRILGEEQACLEKYGASYQEYMKAVPRYIFPHSQRSQP